MKHYNKVFAVQPENESLLVAEAFGIQEGWDNRIVDVDLPEQLPGITLITGESGCGKSTLIKMLGMPLAQSPIPDRPLHSWGATEEDSLRLLNAIGLNDASLFVLRFQHLSDSQQARARMYLHLCNTTSQIYVDEFLSTLDRRTAQALAFSFQKTLRKEGIQLIAATAHQDLMPFLQPDLAIVGTAFPSRWRTLTRDRNITNPFTVVVSEKDKDAYRESSLGELHYKGKYTGGRQQYFAATLEDEVVGWLVGKVVPGTKQHRIARVVVHPTFRGCGAGTALVRRYLEEHPDCDTVASMARFNPVFEKAGMRRVSDVLITPPAALKAAIPLTQLEWASKQKCTELMSERKWREKVAPFASTQFVNPGGTLNGSANRKQAVQALVLESEQAAASVLWGLRPRQMAKFVGPTWGQ